MHVLDRPRPDAPRGRAASSPAPRSRSPRTPSCEPNGPCASRGLSGSLRNCSRCSPRTTSNWYSTREPSGSSVVTYHRSVSAQPAQPQRVGQADHPVSHHHLVGVPRHRNVARAPSMIGAPWRSRNRSIGAASSGRRSSSRLIASLRWRALRDRDGGRRSSAASPGCRPCRRRRSPARRPAAHRRPQLDPGAVVEQQAARVARTGGRAPARAPGRRGAAGGARAASRRRPRTRPSPRSQTSAPWTPCGPRSLKSTTRSVIAIAPGRPGDHGQLARQARPRTAAGSAAACRRDRRRWRAPPRRPAASATSSGAGRSARCSSAGAAASSSPYSWSTVSQVPVRRCSARRRDAVGRTPRRRVLADACRRCTRVHALERALEAQRVDARRARPWRRGRRAPPPAKRLVGARARRVSRP